MEDEDARLSHEFEASRTGSIFDRQNTPRALRLLAAQRRLYSDSKVVHNLRMVAVFGGAGLTLLATLIFKDARILVGLISATVLLLIGVLGGVLEKRRSQEAATVQEEFDTYVFSLGWNDMLAERPSPTLVASAERRSTSSGLKNWYPDTKSVPRPLDILICQRSNVGWGASLHRLWATVLSFALAAMIAIVIGLGVLIDASLAETLAGLIAPILGPIRELAEMVRGHADNGRNKASLEVKILSSWRKGLDDLNSVTDADCRSVQDRIFMSRQSNLSIPNWINSIRQDALEYSMQASARHLIEEARDRGLA
ncbi:S-4TM family putative pore-forming effector [Amycolatopsis sp. cmx-4-54]|uniref:S-4TM family putative pore-forming effector n=1 Tax=Amycolatopsis sp. cmx-4-54 TaxID=2790936 RepID=UPI00397938A4